MDDDLGLLHGAEDVAAHDGVADMHGGEEVPFCVALQRGDLHAALQVVAGDPHDRVQRALDAVVDRADQARPSSTLIGSPVDSTGAPGPRPEVSS